MPSLFQLSITMIVLGALFALINWIAWIASLRSGRHISGVPLLGGLLILAGMLLSTNLRPFAWIGILVDPGTFLFLAATPAIWRDAWSLSRFNLLEEYAGQSAQKSVCMRFFRRGWFTMEQRSLGPDRTVVRFVSYWRREGNRMWVVMNGIEAEFAILSTALGSLLQLVVDFQSKNALWDYSLGEILLTRTLLRGEGTVAPSA